MQVRILRHKQFGNVWTFLLTAVAFPVSAFAQTPREHDIEAEDYFSIGVITGCVTSPTGGAIAYTEVRWEPPVEKRNTDLWVVDSDSRHVTRLTFDRAADGSPQWSHDGRFLYFGSSRKRSGESDPPYNGKRQVWRVSASGAEVTAVTRLKDGIGRFELSADSRTLYYTVSKEDTDELWKDLRSEYKDLTYGHGVTKFSQVWKLDLELWRSEKLVDEKRVILDMKVSSNGRRIAMITTPDEEIIFSEGQSRIDVFDTETQKVTTVTPDGWREDHPSPYGWLDSVSWADDGDALGLTVSYDGFPTRIYVVEWTGDEPSLRQLARPAGVSVTGGTIGWRPTSRDIGFIGEEHARARVYAIQDVRDGGQGEVKTWTPGDVAVKAFDFSRDGMSVAAVLATTQHPPDLYEFFASGQSSRLTRANPQVDTWKLPQISLVKWKGANGDEVEGILELPPDYKPGTRLPMVVEIHGGPTAATLYEFRFWIYGRTLMAATGFALLSPNYRGSTGYGDKFMTDLIGRENDIEVEDILKGVDAMIEMGIADPDRLAVMGWSNGGFLTNCLITTTDRFKAASSGAGVLDQVIQWGTEDTPGHVINYMQNQPWTDPEAYRSGSPLYNMHKVKTPTLIHVGENDPRVPQAHSRTLYRALRHYVKVPTELIVYPDEGHGLTTYTHRKAKMQWDLAWFDRYLQTSEKKEIVETSAN